MLIVLSQPGDFVKISQGPNPLKYVTALTGWDEDTSGIGIVQKEFRWSTTNRVYSAWIPLSTPNLTKIILDPTQDLFVDFRYTLISNGTFTIKNAEILYTQNNYAKDPYLGFTPPMTVADKGNISFFKSIAPLKASSG